jgi:hypothetical protein
VRDGAGSAGEQAELSRAMANRIAKYFFMIYLHFTVCFDDVLVYEYSSIGIDQVIPSRSIADLFFKYPGRPDHDLHISLDAGG